MKCQFCDEVDVIHVADDSISDDSLLMEGTAYLVRTHHNSKPYIVINTDQAERDLYDNGIDSNRLEDYLTFIEAHEVVHFLEEHLEQTNENEFKADLYGTALCAIKGHSLAADIGIQRIGERYDLDEPVSDCVRDAIADLQS